MKTLRHIMRHGFLFVLQRDTTVADACRMMAAHNVGIVAILDGERLCGVFSERDVTRRVVDRRLDPARTRLEEVMTSELVVADADEDYQSAMNKMDQANVRHLPVISGSYWSTAPFLAILIAAAPGGWLCPTARSQAGFSL